MQLGRVGRLREGVAYSLRRVSGVFPLGLGCVSVLVPLLPFQYLSIAGVPAWISWLIRFFPFALVVALLIAELLTAGGRSRKGSNSAYCALVVSVFLAQTTASILSTEAIASVLRSGYYAVTGEFLFWLILAKIDDRRTIETLVAVNLVACCLVTAVGLGEVLGEVTYLRDYLFTMGNPWYARFSQVSRKVYSTIGNPNPLGTYLCLFAPFFWFSAVHGRGRVARFLSAFSGVNACVLLYFTFSRGAWLAFLVATLVLVASKRRRGMPVILLVFTLFVVDSIQKEKMRDPYRDVVENYGEYHRTRSFGIACQVWQTRPLLGVGVGNYRYLSKPLGSTNDTPDNMYLLLLAETGILGLALRIGIGRKILLELLQALKRLPPAYCQDRASKPGSRRREGDRDLMLSSIASLLAFWVNMLSWDALYFPVTRMMFWTVAGLSVASARLVCDGATCIDPHRRS